MGERDCENEVKRKVSAQLACAHDPAERFRCKAILRGLSTMKNIGRSFRILDRDNSRNLDKTEFWNAIAMWQIKMDKPEFDSLFQSYSGADGKIDYEEFLAAVRPPMNEAREKIVEKAFRSIQMEVEEAKLELAKRQEEQQQQQQPAMQQKQQKIPEMPRSATGSRPTKDFITTEEMALVYDVSKHPKVQNGEMTEHQAIRLFIDNFQGEDTMDDKVTLDEFKDYYRVVGLSHDHDAGFNHMIHMSWGVSLADSNSTGRKPIRKAHKMLVQLS